MIPILNFQRFLGYFQWGPALIPNPWAAPGAFPAPIPNPWCGNDLVPIPRFPDPIPVPIPRFPAGPAPAAAPRGRSRQRLRGHVPVPVQPLPRQRRRRIPPQQVKPGIPGAIPAGRGAWEREKGAGINPEGFGVVPEGFGINPEVFGVVPKGFGIVNCRKRFNWNEPLWKSWKLLGGIGNVGNSPDPTPGPLQEGLVGIKPLENLWKLGKELGDVLTGSWNSLLLPELREGI